MDNEKIVDLLEKVYIEMLRMKQLNYLRKRGRC